MNQLFLRLASLSMQKALMIGLGLTGFWYFMMFNDGSEISGRLSKARADLQQEKLKEKESDKALAEIAAVRASIGSLSDQFKLVSAQLPTEIQMSDVLKTVDKISIQAGLNVKSKEPRAAFKQELMEVYPLLVTAEGSYSEFTSFFYYLASLERIVRVRSFKMLAPGEYKKGQKLVLSADISSYKYVGASAKDPTTPVVRGKK